MESIKFFKQKKRVVILIFFFAVLFMPLVSAVQPSSLTQQFQMGYAIVDSPQKDIVVGKDFQVNFFVYNLSTGVLLDDSAIECVYYLSNSSGNVLHYTIVDYDKTSGKYGHFNTNILGDNFSKAGKYFYGIKCNSTALGGAVIGSYDATLTGEELTTAKSILNLGFLTLIILLLFATITGFVSIDPKNKKNPEGEIVDINNLKYLRGVLLAFGYALLVAVFFIASNLAISYLTGQLFGQVLFILYRIFFLMGLPFIVLWFIWLFVSVFQDKDYKNMIERGVQFGDEV